MKKNDLYLDDFQMQTIFDLHKGDTDDLGMPFYKELSKASAEYAVKKVIELLEDALENTAYYDHRQARVWEIIEELNQLIEE